MSRGWASEKSVCVYETVSVEEGARCPPLPAAVVCPPGGRRRWRLAITAEGLCAVVTALARFWQCVLVVYF